VAGTLSKLTRVATADGSRAIAGADAFKRLVFGFLVALFLLVLGVAIFFARRMTRDVLRPIELLQQTATQLAAGDLKQRVAVHPRRHPNELSELATTLNLMADTVDASYREVSHQANHDSLTGLSNRAAFEADLADRMTTFDERRLDGMGVLFIDIDDFKLVNDSLGHAAGDALLKQVARRLESCVRPSDRVARLGGDEFAILVVDTEQGHRPSVDVAGRVLDSLSASFTLSGKEVDVGVSIGIAVRSPETGGPDELLRRADVAMYAAKSAGKRRMSLFDPSGDANAATLSSERS
jgi:diguanylate cyclase (GGDEF)-like protein